MNERAHDLIVDPKVVRDLDHVLAVCRTLRELATSYVTGFGPERLE